MAASSTMTRDAAVCATIPGRGSWKIRFVIACRRRRRVLVSERPIVVAIWVNVVVLLMGKDWAGLMSRYNIR